MRRRCPETCGDAATLVDPDDREGFAQATLAAATDEALRSERRSRGLIRAAAFSWERTAQEVDRAVERVLGQT